MEKITVKGGRPLVGEIFVSGSKNAALPILFATLATRGVSKIDRVPNIADVRVAVRILSSLGAHVLRIGESLYVDTEKLYYKEPDPHLTSSIRASTYLLSGMLSAFGRCPLMSFGGCDFADRPIDLHLYALECFGAKISDNLIVCEKPRNAEICFEKASVGATANALIAAAAIKGKSIIRGHACEPHVMALVDFLRSAGAKISVSKEKITVVGTELHGGTTSLIGDMIEAGSYLAAGLVTDGCVTVRGCPAEHLSAFVDFLHRTGADVSVGDTCISCQKGKNHRYSEVLAEPYPAFPTDLQPIAAVIMACGAGGSIRDNVFPERFGYLAELSNFGVEFEIGQGRANIFSSSVSSGFASAPDLRGGMACLICALCAEGKSTVYSPEKLLRGYDDLENKLRSVGAEIEFS